MSDRKVTDRQIGCDNDARPKTRKENRTRTKFVE